MTTPHTVAVGYLRRRMAAGITLERFLAGGFRGEGTPSTDSAPNVCIRRQGHHLAITLEWRDGRCERGAYDVRVLWQDIESERPIQMRLFEDAS